MTSNTARQSERSTNRGKDDGWAPIRGNEAGLRSQPHFFRAGVPLIAIPRGPTPQSRYRHAYQEVDDLSQFDAVTKFNAQIDHVSRMPDLIRQAFRAATTGAPGPVH